MNYSLIKKNSWKGFFDDVSRNMNGQHIEIEVASLDAGDQVQEEWTPLVGLNYDPLRDVLDIYTSHLSHSIRHPQEVVIAEKDDSLRSVTIKNSQGELQILHFRQPLMLSIPKEATDAAPW